MERVTRGEGQMTADCVGTSVRKDTAVARSHPQAVHEESEEIV